MVKQRTPSNAKQTASPIDTRAKAVRPRVRSISAIPRSTTKPKREAYQKERDSKDDALRADQARQNQVIAKATNWMAIFAGVNLLVAIVYAIFAFKTLKAVQAQAEHAGHGLEEQRAYIGVNVKVIFANGIFVLTIKNYGNTPANDVVVAFTVEPRFQPPAPPDKVHDADYAMTGLRLGLISPREDREVNAQAVEAISSEDGEFLKRGNKSMYCWGLVTYRDMFEKPRRTWFSFWEARGLTTSTSIPCQEGNEAE